MLTVQLPLKSMELHRIGDLPEGSVATFQGKCLQSEWFGEKVLSA